LQDHPTAFNPGIAAVEVAEKIAFGTMAAEMKDYPIAIKFLKEAVEKEDGMLYNEPRDWQLPSRQYLGNVLLQAKQYKEAEAVYKKDLLINPNNKWSLTGLVKALQMQGKKKEASAVAAQLKKQVAAGDDPITASVF
jgi:tetratricopeptide (TPR) repeat protein